MFVSSQQQANIIMAPVALLSHMKKGLHNCMFVFTLQAFTTFYLFSGALSTPLNVDFSSLNVEQLIAVEGQERQNVEARINMLRTVHALLDAAIIQLNQYTQMINMQR